ncbi:twin-arginine translocase subunit TatC [Termitidicoccus mucosus]|uniref:Sec-independent protein translocase protein TatC n=1 Tax=Termitidicoccus mucosus TaxID=1184151 RepID=A0A178ILW8_9BACT|nr:hypothetical protein AW736_07050 [Opitutaceae bacterium TSB47]
MKQPDDFSDEDELDPTEKPMGFFEHLEELRWTLVKCVIVYAVFAIAIGIFLKQFNAALLWPLEWVRHTMPEMKFEMAGRTPTEAFSIVIQLCCLGALLPAMPFFFFFLGQFVGPALTKTEKRMVLPVCFSSLLLFLAGSSFSFFLLVPSTLKISLELNNLLGFDPPIWTPASYYSTLSWLVIGVGVAFEFPLLILLLVYLGFISTATLRKYRRHAIVVIFIVAAIITPTPDPFTQTIFAAPLYALFEIAIFVGGRMEKKRAARLEAGEL